MDEKIKNYEILGKQALKGGNSQEAYEYFTKILELDPNNIDAWMGKGTSAGWMSTVAHMRFSEMMSSFSQAIELSNDKDEIFKLAARELNEIATEMYVLCRKHMEQFVSLEDTWPSYIIQCQQIIDAYEVAHIYAPEDLVIMKNIIHLCSDNISGYSFNDQFDNQSKAVFLAPEYEQQLKRKIDDFTAKIQQIDSTFKAPTPVAAKPESMCFIATATVGDGDHHIVMAIREFRDNFLNKSKLGKKFISFYYKYSPFYAKKVESSNILRLISFILIVLPAYILSIGSRLVHNIFKNSSK